MKLRFAAKLMFKLLMKIIWCNITYQTKCLFTPPNVKDSSMLGLSNLVKTGHL